MSLRWIWSESEMSLGQIWVESEISLKEVSESEMSLSTVMSLKLVGKWIWSGSEMSLKICLKWLWSESEVSLRSDWKFPEVSLKWAWKLLWIESEVSQFTWDARVCTEAIFTTRSSESSSRTFSGIFVALSTSSTLMSLGTLSLLKWWGLPPAAPKSKLRIFKNGKKFKIS